MPRTAQVKRDARIGEAEARRDAGIKVNNTTVSDYYDSVCVNLAISLITFITRAPVVFKRAILLELFKSSQ